MLAAAGRRRVLNDYQRQLGNKKGAAQRGIKSVAEQHLWVSSECQGDA